MADKYSNLYTTPPNGSGRHYRGPVNERSGEIVAVFATYDNSAADPLGAGEALHICKVAEGAKLVAFTAIAGADLDTNNDFTFNLGFTSVTNGMASAANGLQATTAYNLATSALLPVAPAVSGDELLLTRQAGSLEAAGTLYIYAEFLVP